MYFFTKPTQIPYSNEIILHQIPNMVKLDSKPNLK